ncbi:MAG: hypothetical protein PHG61_08535 [Candidatus Marinimicrobia bacterium]|nr:hypothetical protein [Candidatus Neomarinimicrobiota bacterium]
MYKYRRGITNQVGKVMTRPTAGLNSYMPPSVIDDSMQSDMLDVSLYRDDCIAFNTKSALDAIGSEVEDMVGKVEQCIHSDESTASIDVFYLMCSTATTWSILRCQYTYATETVLITDYTMQFAYEPRSDIRIYENSSAVFKTEQETFYVFSVAWDMRIHYVKASEDGYAYGYIDVPARPRKMVPYANRIFYIDTNNKIWWCRGGDLFSWYSMEYDADAIVTTRNCGNESFTIAAQPNTTRQITATVTKTDTLDTLGIVTVVGKNGLGAAQTEILTLAEGMVQSSKAFQSIDSITQSGWTQGGATPDTITIGTAPRGMGYVVDDAGFWTIEDEVALLDISKIGGDLFIFTHHNIYVFRGHSPDSFQLTLVIADVGIDTFTHPYGFSKITTAHNMAFFLYDDKVYSFDGNSHPRIISRPIIINNQSSNGVLGGISFTGEEWSLVAIADHLYLYDRTMENRFIYEYHYETRTWWKRSGFSAADIGAGTNDFFAQYVPSYDRKRVILFGSIMSTPRAFVFSYDMGCLDTNVLPYIVSKAYNTNPSESGTVTEVLLYIEGIKDAQAEINISYSLSANADDFIALEPSGGYVFNGDGEIITVYLPTFAISRAHHYRIKIEIKSANDAYPVYLYNIERRFRLTGKSR